MEVIEKEKIKLRVLNLSEKLAQQKYNEEMSREQSLLTQASQMQTAFSVITAVLFMLLPILIDKRGPIDLTLIFIFISIISLFLLISFIFALSAQWRFKIKTIISSEIQDDVIDNINELSSEEDVISFKINLLKNLHDEKFKINNKRVFYITLSIITSYLSLITCVIYYCTSVVILITNRGI